MVYFVDDARAVGVETSLMMDFVRIALLKLKISYRVSLILSYQCQPINETCYEPNSSYDYSGFYQPQPLQDSVDHQGILQVLNKMQEELEEMKQDRRKKIEDMSEEIDEEYERDCEIKIHKLKQDFNIWGSEVRKKEKAYEDEKYVAARRYMLSIPCNDEDDSISLGDIIAQYSTSKAITPDLPTGPINSTKYKGISISTLTGNESERLRGGIEPSNKKKKEFDLEEFSKSLDVSFRERLLKISCLITNIESLKDNPTPIPVTDSDSFDISLSFSNNSLPEFESLSDHTEETRSGITTTHANYSLPEYDSFLFEIEPDQEGLISIDNSNNTNFWMLPELNSFQFRSDLSSTSSGTTRC
ncbi:hypothetical protein Tco_1252555 [Tanacetum coccineum]